MELRSGKLLAGLAASFCLGGHVLAQAPSSPGLKRPSTQAPEAAAKTQEQWIDDLGNESYRVRLEAEKALGGLGKDALPALRKAAEEAKDNEVQWRVRRLIQKAEGGKSGGLRPRGSGTDEAQEPGGVGGRSPFDSGDLGGQFEDMFRQMERQFGLDIPRGRFFQDDFFRDLQDQMKAGNGVQQGMSMQIGPDGAVKVEVKEQNEKGEVESKVYEAPDMESFHRQYPGVLQKNGLGGAMQFQFGPRNLRLAPQVLRPEPLRRALRAPVQDQDQDPQDLQVMPQQVPPPDGKRLGVFVRPEVPADVRDYLELAEGTGLLVESVQDGSLAASLDLQRGDIITKIADTNIGSTEDVQQALGGIEAGKDVVVSFLRKGREKTAKAAKPAVAEVEGQKGGDEGQPLKRRAKAKKDETIR
jgi:hypothetical protein